MKHAAGKGHDPRPMSKAGRADYARTLAAIYGVRVKIPPPGPELDDLVAFLRVNSYPLDGSVPLERVEHIIRQALGAWVAKEAR